MFQHQAHTIQVHDLLEIDAAGVAAGLPEWAAAELASCPIVVVRRGLCERDTIPVGIRGKRREERWATFCDLGLVARVVTPAQLLDRFHRFGSLIDSIPSGAKAPSLGGACGGTVPIPAMQALWLLKARWAGLRLPWGPGGSVGFELATGRPTATPESDLDVVVDAREHLSRQKAMELCELAADLPATVDIRVETPACGFSMREYATAGGGRILLRTAGGPVLGEDPWAVDGGVASYDRGRRPYQVQP